MTALPLAPARFWAKVLPARGELFVFPFWSSPPHGVALDGTSVVVVERRRYPVLRDRFRRGLGSQHRVVAQARL